VTTEDRLRDIRVPYLGWIALGICVLAVIPLLYLGRHLTFFADEWTFIVERGLSGIDGWLRPHNEHWSTIPLLIYRTLFAIVGLRAYWPYLLVLELLHAGSAFLLFALVRRRSGDLLALAAMLSLLFLGRGSENILWAFQIGFVGSVFCGLLAMLLLDPPSVSTARLAAASAALLAALMFSGIGLFFCAALAIGLALDPGRRRRLVALVIPAAAYLAWFVTFGATATSGHRSPLTTAALLSLPSFVPFGVGSALAGLVGLSSRWAAVFLAFVAALLALRWYQRRRIGSAVLGAGVAILLQFALTGLVRGQLGDLQAAEPRYVYVAAVFLILIITDAVAELAVSRRVVAASAVVFLAALAYSGAHLQVYAHQRNAAMNLQAAQLQTVTAFRHAPSIDADTFIDGGETPVTSRQYDAAVDALGSPVPSVDVNRLLALPAVAVDPVVRRLFARSLTAGQIGSGPVAGSCKTYDGRVVSSVDVRPPSNQPVDVSLSDGGPVDVSLTLVGEPTGPPDLQLELAPQTAMALRVPDAGAPIGWRLRIGLPGAGTATICAP